MERVTGVLVEQRVPLNRPVAGKFRDELSIIRHLSVEAAVPLKNVVAALDFVSVAPFTYEFALIRWPHGCTRHDQKKKERERRLHA
jgi:hypothetical protein